MKERSMQIIPPTECPSCGHELIEINEQLFCRSPTCPAQNAKLVENFAKVLKIKGLGPATIEKLEFSSIEDIYALDKDYYTDVLGEKVGSKLFAEVEQSKKAPLNTVLAGLGIPLIGKTAADKICSVINDLKELDEDKAREILGPKASQNLISYLQTTDWEQLPFSFKSEKIVTNGPTVCITGKLKSFKTKAEAAEYLTEKGYKVVTSVTKTTEILVNESGIESSKTTKARANGTQVITNILEL